MSSSTAQNLRIAAVLLVFLVLIDVISFAYADKVSLSLTHIHFIHVFNSFPNVSYLCKIFSKHVSFLLCCTHRILKMCVASVSVHLTEISADISTKRTCPRKTGETGYCTRDSLTKNLRCL